MSGIAPPWSIPNDLAILHNNGRDGLSAAGYRAYDQWELDLARRNYQLIKRLRQLKAKPPTTS